MALHVGTCSPFLFIIPLLTKNIHGIDVPNTFRLLIYRIDDLDFGVTRFGLVDNVAWKPICRFVRAEPNKVNRAVQSSAILFYVHVLRLTLSVLRGAKGEIYPRLCQKLLFVVILRVREEKQSARQTTVTD